MADTISSDSVASDQLRAFIERIERMEEEKKAIADDIKEIYAEAKGNGFSAVILREIIKIRKQDHAERMEREALLELYMSALGMQSAPREDDDDDEPPRGSRRDEQRPAALEMRRDEITEADNADASEQAAASAQRPALARPSDELGTAGDDCGEPEALNNSPETATDSSSVETKSGIGSARDASAMLHPGVADGPTAIALQAGTVVTVGRDRQLIPTPAGGGNTTEPDSGLGHTSGPEVRANSPQGVRPGKSQAEQSASAPAKRQWKFNDPAHLDCLNPDQCGGFSNLKLCPGCAAEALSARQVA